jgi:hypothetical protein
MTSWRPAFFFANEISPVGHTNIKKRGGVGVGLLQKDFVRKKFPQIHHISRIKGLKLPLIMLSLFFNHQIFNFTI